MVEIDALVDEAMEKGQSAVAPMAHWTMSGHLARKVRTRHANDGATKAADYAIDRLEEHMRSSRLRNAAYALVSGDQAAEVARHLEERLAGEGGSAMMAALYLLASQQAGREANLRLTSALNWCAALQRLFDDLPPERLVPIMEPVLALFPDMGFLKELAEITTFTPVIASPFADTMEASVQLVPAGPETGRNLVVAMSGGEGRLGLPHTILHRWFAGEPSHMLYLRDLSGRSYHNGVEMLGPDRSSMLDGITAIADRLGCREIVVLCNSAAGVPGLRAGMELGATRIVSFSPRPNGAGRPAGARATMEERMTALERDIPVLVSDWAASSEPDVLIVHGAANKQDSLFAAAMAEILSAKRWPLPARNRHNSILEAMREGVLAGIISWLSGSRSDLSVPPA